MAEKASKTKPTKRAATPARTPAPASTAKPIVHLVTGSDEAAVKDNALRLSRELAPDDPLNFEIIDAAAGTVDEAVRAVDNLAAALLTLPFFGGPKVVWWKNLNFIDDSVVGKSASVKEALERIVPIMLDTDGGSVVVLISALSLHKAKPFTKSLLKIAKVQTFELPDMRRYGEQETIGILEDKLRDAGLTTAPGAAELLFQAMGNDTMGWRQEIEKLVCYHGPDNPAPLTREEVAAIVGSSREVLVWDFCDAVLRGHPALAMTQLRQILLQGELSEVGALVLLAGQIRQAALAGTLREAGLLRVTSKGNFASVDVSPDGMALLPRKKDGEPISTFMLGQIAGKTARKPAAYWRHALEIVYQANKAITSGTADKLRAVETAVLSIAG